MIVYCLGDAKAKRAAFRSTDGGINSMSIDNDEILTVLKNDGKTYFAVGDIPFADMSVSEFVAYSKSLCKTQPARRRETSYYAKLFGFKSVMNKKLKKLSVPQYRMAQFLAKYDLSVRDVYVNFDGLEYSRANKKALEGFLSKIKRYFNIYVGVSDYRFMRYGASLRHYGAEGETSEITVNKYRSLRGKKRVFKTILDKTEQSAGDFNIRKVVVAFE